MHVDKRTLTKKGIAQACIKISLLVLNFIPNAGPTGHSLLNDVPLQVDTGWSKQKVQKKTQDNNSHNCLSKDA